MTAIPGFTGDVIIPADARYDEARALWNAMIDTRPAVITRCRSTSDVVAALAHARREGLEVAVRGGGHSVAGLSSSERGMVIDLRAMNQVTIDPRRRTARVQGGALLGDLDGAAHRHGLATTGGMVHHTGVAGLTLGGGYGWLGRLHGLSCDNLVSAEVVTADRDVVTASADEHPELLWGLRGGGGNFGVVTTFEFALHPIGPIVSRQIRFPAAGAHLALRRYRDVMDAAPRALCSLAGVESGRGTGIVDPAPRHEFYVWYTYAGDDPDEGRRLGDPLLEMPGAIEHSCEILSYPALQSITGAASGPGKRHYWKGSLLWELSDDFLDAFVEQGATTRPGAGIEMFSLGGAICDVAEDATAYSNRSARFDLLPAATWESPSGDDEMIAITRNNWTALSRFGGAGVYVNDLGTDAGARITDVYGHTKLARLAALKATWDPDNIFHLNANIPPNHTVPIEIDTPRQDVR